VTFLTLFGLDFADFSMLADQKVVKIVPGHLFIFEHPPQPGFGGVKKQARRYCLDSKNGLFHGFTSLF
jgi:hypothetical protein